MRIFIGAMALCCMSMAHAALNDVFPADYVSLPATTTVITTYAYERHSSGPYVSGKQTAPWSLDANIGVLRLGHFLT